ncbi:MAG: glycosyltransferase family 39 protein, partial [Myxococcota bacterium]
FGACWRTMADVGDVARSAGTGEPADGVLPSGSAPEDRGGGALARDSRAWWGVLAGITLLAIGLRLWVASWVFPVGVTGDEAYYLEVGFQLASGNEHVAPSSGARAAWPPGYPFFLAAFMDVRSPGASSDALLWDVLSAQAVLGGLLVLLTGLLAAALFDRETGWLAAAVAAIYPTFVAFSHYLFSETLFSVLLLVALLGVIAWPERRRWALATGVGLGFGVAALTREIAIPIAVGCVLWWVLQAGRGARRIAVAHGALLLLGLALVVAPWSLRNYAALDRIVPVSNAGWLNLRSGNTLAGEDWLWPDGRALEGFRTTYFLIPDEMDRAHYARSQSRVLILAEQPTWVFKKFARAVALIGNPDTYLFKKVSRGTYAGLSLPTVRAVLIAGVLSFVLIVLLGLPGVFASPSRGRRSFVFCVFGAAFLIYWVANAAPRYRFPLMPILIAYACFSARHPRLVQRSLRGGHGLLAAVALVVFVFFCIPYFVPDAVSLWSVGTYRDPFRP